MKSLKELIDFAYLLGKNQLWLYAYISIYMVYALTTGIEDPLLGLSICVFLAAPILPSFLMFVFFLLWEYVSTFSFGLTTIMIMQIIMIIKILIDGHIFTVAKKKYQKDFYSLQVFLLIFTVIYGIGSFVIANSLTGFSFVFKVLVTFYVISFYGNDKTMKDLIKSIFQVLMISSLIATVYGSFHDTSLDRWISGLGDVVSQLYGTLGTTRMAFFYLISFTFFLYYIRKGIIRYLGLAFFTVLNLMTVSLTAFILYFCVIAIYMFSLGKINSLIKYSTIVFVVGAFAFPLVSQIKIVQPVLYRITYSYDAFEQGDVNGALTGREELTNIYMNNWENSGVVKQVFGNMKSSMSSTGSDINSHNTYIDILYYFGVLGLMLLAIYQARKFILIRKKPYFFPLVTMKIIVLLGGVSVSIMTATYFFFIIFI